MTTAAMRQNLSQFHNAPQIKRVLIVDDDEDFAESLAELLETHSYTVACAHSASQAQKSIETFPADVALLDIRLGNDNGISLINGLKCRKPDLVCILVTAYAELDSVVGAIHEGAYDYLRKPLNALILFATLARSFDQLRNEREKRQSQIALAKSEARYRELVETAQDVIFRCGSDLCVTFINPVCEELFGYQPCEIIGKPFSVFQDAPIAVKDRHVFEQVLHGESLHGYETFLLSKDQQRVYILVNAIRVFDEHHKVVGIQGTMHEISQRKQAEEKLKQSLAEKELLLKEVYHRVKNNLQLISSLLSLQANHSGQRPTQEIFDECQARVRTMALVHERLYQSKNLSHIELGEFTRTLAADLHRSLNSSQRHIQLDINADTAYLTVDKAVPCGLILNELLSNALKHAFVNADSGRISVNVQDNANGSVTISITDNGPGLPADLDWKESKTLGLKLVNALARQLKTTLQYTPQNGACFTLTFESGHA